MMETSPPEDVKPGNTTETLKLTFSAPHRGKFKRKFTFILVSLTVIKH